MYKTAIKDILQKLAEHKAGELKFDTGDASYVRIFAPPKRLILLGCGHISQALCRLAAQLDFTVMVADDRPVFANSELFPDASHIICDSFENAISKLKITAYDYVAVLTRGHRWDADCLRVIFQGEMPSYLGLIGSKRRVRGLLRLLVEEGFSQHLTQEIKSPIGLDIRAVTPAEIAVSILAEMILHSHTIKLDNQALPQQNTDFKMLYDLLENPDRVLAVVIETKGSVPVEAGAIMSADLLGRRAGTVGGGCGENEVIVAARSVLKNRQSQLIFLDMTAEVAEGEGMVCGGWMKVWLEPVLD